MDDDYEKNKKQTITDGEQEALRIAIEERRSLQREAEAKRCREEIDSKLAKDIIIDDVENESKFQELCDKDGDYAKQVHDAMQDELYAQELYEKEQRLIKKAAKRNQDIEEADRHIAMIEQQKIDDELHNEYKKQVHNDFELASRTKITMETQYQLQKKKQEANDSYLSQQLAIKTMREEHRRKKRLQLLSSSSIVSSSDVNAVAKIWEEADVEVEDVANGVCMTILLPYLLDLKVKRMKKQIIEITATRAIYEGDTSATPDNSSYNAEFVIDGCKVDIRQEDLSYDYNSECGLLHIYIDNIYLDNDGDGDDSEARVSMVSAITKSLSRIFGRK